jgi:hypothetical protein
MISIVATVPLAVLTLSPWSAGQQIKIICWWATKGAMTISATITVAVNVNTTYHCSRNLCQGYPTTAIVVAQALFPWTGLTLESTLYRY